MFFFFSSQSIAINDENLICTLSLFFTILNLNSLNLQLLVGIHDYQNFFLLLFVVLSIFAEPVSAVHGVIGVIDLRVRVADGKVSHGRRRTSDELLAVVGRGTGNKWWPVVRRRSNRRLLVVHAPVVMDRLGRRRGPDDRLIMVRAPVAMDRFGPRLVRKVRSGREERHRLRLRLMVGADAELEEFLGEQLTGQRLQPQTDEGYSGRGRRQVQADGRGHGEHL